MSAERLSVLILAWRQRHLPHAALAWITLARLLQLAQPLPEATRVRVISCAGYRWSFPLADADTLLQAVGVGNKALSRIHGAPVRLVAPGHRGFQCGRWKQRRPVRSLALRLPHASGVPDIARAIVPRSAVS
ncbi:MAG: hypothetical protein NVS2B7_24010 [Herpetosiphon sp.]